MRGHLLIVLFLLFAQPHGISPLVRSVFSPTLQETPLQISGALSLCRSLLSSVLPPDSASGSLNSDLCLFPQFSEALFEIPLLVLQSRNLP